MATADPLADLSHEEKRALAELARASAEGRIDRRDLLKAGGVLGLGALLGGGASTAIDPASAAASDSDTDGDVGEPTDRVDVFGDGASLNELSHEAATGVSASLGSAIQDGLIVAVPTGSVSNAKVVDPGNHANDAAAIQAANDYLVSNAFAGALHIPHIGPDGSPLAINSQVVIGSTSSEARISAYFHGGGRDGGSGGNQTNAIQINTTSPAFLQTSASTPARGVEFVGGYFTGLGNNVSILELKDVTDAVVSFRAFVFGGDAITLSGTANCLFNQIILTPDNSSARGFVFQENATGVGQNGNSDHIIGPQVHIHGSHDVGLHSTDTDAAAGRMTVGGHYEGAQGTAEFLISTGDWFVTPMTQNLLGGGSSTHAIDMNCRTATIAPSFISGAGGDGIRGTASRMFKISPNINFNPFASNFGGTRINITAASNNVSLVPAAAMVPNGDVSYPTGMTTYSTTTT